MLCIAQLVSRFIIIIISIIVLEDKGRVMLLLLDIIKESRGVEV